MLVAVVFVFDLLVSVNINNYYQYFNSNIIIFLSRSCQLSEGHLNFLFCFSGPTDPTFANCFVSFEVGVQVYYLLSMRSKYFKKNVIDLNCSWLIDLFSFTG